MTLAALIFISSLSQSATQEWKQLQGNWYPQSWNLAGSTTKPPEFNSMKLTIKGQNYVFTEGKSEDIGTTSIELKKSPHEMTLKGIKGPNAGKSIPCIYKLDKDGFTVCYGLMGTRPKSFDVPKGAMILLVTYGHKPAKISK